MPVSIFIVSGRRYFLFKTTVFNAQKETIDLKNQLQDLINRSKATSIPIVQAQPTVVQRAEFVSFKGTNLAYGEAEALKELENLTKTQFVKMDQLKWDSLNGFIAENNRVTGICLYGLRLTQLPASFSQLNALERLFVSGNNLNVLPPFLTQFLKLQVLDVGSNRLTSLPDDIGALSSLKELRINNNQLSSIPPTIGNLKALQLLDITGNNIKSLPDSMGQLAGLQVLYVEKNPLTVIPETLLKLETTGLHIYK